ncbi:BC1872 family protein [Paenibacillus sp. FSL L8-0494]|uniref:BC1872 family protein n=1 Tax=Paenibacillus sp. FSL L8-0494 TaxID=2975352 RepID=UPI0030FD00E3
MTLTREEIQTLTPGRELDALIAEHVMALDMVEGQLPQLPRYFLTDYEKTIHRDVPLYSSDIAAAWPVLERMQVLGWSWDMKMNNLANEVEVRIGRGQAVNKIVPLAICKAALIANLDAIKWVTDV